MEKQTSEILTLKKQLEEEQETVKNFEQFIEKHRFTIERLEEDNSKLEQHQFIEPEKQKRNQRRKDWFLSYQ